MRTATATRMVEASLIKLMTLLSPTFPVGGFAWSGGLEAACQGGSVNDAQSLEDWLLTGLRQGTMRQDAILLGTAWDAAGHPEPINEMALALAGSAERYQETTSLGTAFAEAAGPWRGSTAYALPDPVAYPIALGVVASENTIPKEQAIIAYLHSAISAQIQAALRLFPLGQTTAMAVQRGLEGPITSLAEVAARSTLDDLGSAAILMDIAAMKHETLTSRIFRS